jgi:hypothetical protein
MACPSLVNPATHLTSAHEIALSGRSIVSGGKKLIFPTTLAELPLWSGVYGELSSAVAMKTKSKKRRSKAGDERKC